jgi:hypothetical protein
MGEQTLRWSRRERRDEAKRVSRETKGAEGERVKVEGRREVREWRASERPGIAWPKTDAANSTWGEEQFPRRGVRPTARDVGGEVLPGQGLGEEPARLDSTEDSCCVVSSAALRSLAWTRRRGHTKPPGEAGEARRATYLVVGKRRTAFKQ